MVLTILFWRVLLLQVSIVSALSDSLKSFCEWASGWKGVISCSCFVFAPCTEIDPCDLEQPPCNLLTTNCSTQAGFSTCACLSEYVPDPFSIKTCKGNDHQMVPVSTDCMDVTRKTTHTHTHAVLTIITFVFIACPNGYKAEGGKCVKWVFLILLAVWSISCYHQ